jgi:hypothetical protein
MTSELPAIGQTLRERVTVIRESPDCLEWLWNGRHFQILQMPQGWRVSVANIGWRAQEHGGRHRTVMVDRASDALQAARALARERVRTTNRRLPAHSDDGGETHDTERIHRDPDRKSSESY